MPQTAIRSLTRSSSGASAMNRGAIARWASWRVEQFELKHNLFAKAMRSVDPSIKLIARRSHARRDGWRRAGQDASTARSFLIIFRPADWSGNLLAHCLDNIDLLSEHFYSTQRTCALDLENRREGQQSRLQSLRRMGAAPATQVRVKYEHYQEYLKRIPGLSSQTGPDRHRRVGLHRSAVQILTK